MDYRRWVVSRRARAPLVEFMVSALRTCGCQVLHTSPASEAPFRITFETPDGERMGILAYAFLANQKLTRNRPKDERRFQIKYGPKSEELHQLWQDPFQLYVTLFFGIDAEEGFFVGADPVAHSPTRFFISLEFKDRHVEALRREGWTYWERQNRDRFSLLEPLEVVVGGLPESFLRYIRFERAAKGLDPGHRALLAERFAGLGTLPVRFPPSPAPAPAAPDKAALHALVRELDLTESEILDLIQSAPRLKMAVRGWVAEEHLVRQLSANPAIARCARLEKEGGADVEVALRGRREVLIECKNVLRGTAADGAYRLDFQRTRASKRDACSRYYQPSAFQVVAACLHPQLERWQFRFALRQEMDQLVDGACVGRLRPNVRLDGRWSDDAVGVLERLPP
jgi:hypothetical protein